MKWSLNLINSYWRKSQALWCQLIKWSLILFNSYWRKVKHYEVNWWNGVCSRKVKQYEVNWWNGVWTCLTWILKKSQAIWCKLMKWSLNLFNSYQWKVKHYEVNWWNGVLTCLTHIDEKSSIMKSNNQTDFEPN